MRTPFRLLLVLITAVALGACSGTGSSPSAASVAPATEPPASEAPASAPASEEPAAAATIELAESDLGTILVDADGMTLYGFTVDTEGVSACYDDCATNWPALIADGDVTVGEGLDQSLVTTVERTDGTMQVKYGDWPLYYFANDGAAGDTNGQGLSEVWYVVGADGALIETATGSIGY